MAATDMEARVSDMGWVAKYVYTLIDKDGKVAYRGTAKRLAREICVTPPAIRTAYRRGTRMLGFKVRREPNDEA